MLRSAWSPSERAEKGNVGGHPFNGELSQDTALVCSRVGDECVEF